MDDARLDPGAPDRLAQLIAHALMLQDVLGFEALSAGLWYVAIDLQLQALFAALLALAAVLAPGRPMPWLAPALMTAAVSASLLHFNRDPGWDAWAVYLAGSYGLGALAWWQSDRARGPAAATLLAGAMLLPPVVALALDFRLRVAVALGTALTLATLRRLGLTGLGAGWGLVGMLGRISFSVFLVHFPVCLVVNAAFTRFAPAEPVAQARGLVLAWAASIAAGVAFHRWVEMPLNRS